MNHRNRLQPRNQRQLSFEPLEARVVLAADFLSVDVETLAATFGNQIEVDTQASRWSLRQMDVPQLAADTVENATTFLAVYHAALGLPASIATELQHVETKYGLASSHVRFQQMYQGIPVANADLSIHADASGAIQTLHNAYQQVNTQRSDDVSVPLFEQAVALAEDAANVQVQLAEPRGEMVWVVDKQGSASLAWELTVFSAQPVGDFLTVIDAETGSVISQDNRAAFATGSGDVFQPNPYQTQGSGSGLSDNNDSNSTALSNQLVTVTLEGLDNGTGLLRGEFVDLSTLNSSSLSDNDANEASRVYQYTRNDDRFEQVVIYDSIDAIQRYFHTLGFDDNTGTANGIRDFPTLANAHWYTQDQSFYSTGDDAVHFGDGGVDDGEDADIIAHEYGHAVQHDQNSCWGGGEMGAMGEGFGDYLAASLYAGSGDGTFQASHAAAVGEWDATSYSGANPPNLRRVDGNKMYPGDLNGSVHGDGEIWSAALWDMRAALGQTTADQLVLEHHFSAPCNASMTDAANAILQADQNINGGANQAAITTAFSDRGILGGGTTTDDHGNNAAAATPVAATSTSTGSIETGSDTDWFAFNVLAGATVMIDVVISGSNTLSDSTLRLYDTNGTTELEFDDDDGPGLASTITRTLATAGTYYAAVGSYSTNTGSYTVNITTTGGTVPGDFNNDGLHNCTDIDALVSVIAAGSNDLAYNLTTGDTLVDGADLTEWLAIGGAANLASENPYLLGDANLNGLVDFADFTIWNANKFTSNPSWCSGDFNANGLIDFADFTIWNANKFQSSAKSAGRVVTHIAIPRHDFADLGHRQLVHQTDEARQVLAQPVAKSTIERVDAVFASHAPRLAEQHEIDRSESAAWHELAVHEPTAEFLVTACDR